MRSETGVGSLRGRAIGWRLVGTVLQRPRVTLVYLMVLVLFVTGVAISPLFRSEQNLFNLLRQSITLGLVSMGMFLAILIAGIDLSVGSVVKLSVLISAAVMNGRNGMLVPGLLTALGIGLAVGLFNGLLVGQLGIYPFIVTFGSFYIVRGVAFAFSTGPIGRSSPVLYSLYSRDVGGVPVVVVLMALVWILFWYIVHRTALGKHIFALGGDESVARLSGLRTRKIKIWIYVASALLAAVAGFYNVGRLGVGDPRLGEGLELDAITAVVVGGTSLFGGRGSVLGVLGGVLLLGLIGNLMDLLQVSVFYQQLIKGAIIVAAVATSVSERGGARSGWLGSLGRRARMARAAGDAGST